VPRIAHRVGAALLSLVLLGAAACSAGPSQRPPVAYHDSGRQNPPAPQSEPEPVPDLGPPAEDLLGWEDCTEQTRRELGDLPAGMTFSCAQLLSSLDTPEDPLQGTVSNALIKTGNGEVPLVVLGDITGEPGTTFAARMATQLPPEVLDTFMIIGMDRRGTGESDPVNCVPQLERETITGFDPRATERAALDQLLGSVRKASQECLLTLDERLTAYDTWRTATDLEELRMELGVPRLHALARGEASRVLTTYAERFPDKVGRMVLDGGLDPTRDALGHAEMQAQSAEQAFDVYAEDCVRRNCPLGPDPRGAVSDLIERVRSAPLPAAGTQVQAGHVVRAVLAGLRDRNSWPALTEALSAARHGDGTGVAELIAPEVNQRGVNPPLFDGDLVTSCNDTTLRVPPQRLTEIAGDWVNRFPVFGGLAVQRLTWCSLWPVPQQPLPELRQNGVPPIPVITTANDPLIPALGSDHLAAQLPTGVLLRWEGAGHGAVGRSSCITAAVSRFLVSAAVPTENMVCPG
jgi:pimeloyl-ACP methyl ester carboxylesterase